MTAQTRYFIEPTDILGFRLECKQCHASVFMMIDPNVKLDSLTMCPNCRTAWLAYPGSGSSTLVPQIAQFAKAISGMVEAIRIWEKGLETLNLPGFSIDLEIKARLAE